MSAIKAKNTKPELAVRNYLHRRGLRYGLHCKDLPGKPDLVFRSRKAVLFVNGCFWHGHNNCKDFRLPKTRKEWWRDKIQKTIDRDKYNAQQLKIQGWRVIVIWECHIKEDQLERIYKSIIFDSPK